MQNVQVTFFMAVLKTFAWQIYIFKFIKLNRLIDF